MNFYESRVDWDRADCRGMDVNGFYFLEEKRISPQDKYNSTSALRSICTACPIWKDCLTWAFANEDYGVWGGLSAVERKSFSSPMLDDIKYKTIQDLKYYGITYQDVLETMQGGRVSCRVPSDKIAYLKESGLTSSQVADILGIQSDSVRRAINRAEKK